MPLDTLKAAKRLQEEGAFTPEQAERIAEVLSEMDVASATKEDLGDLEGRLDSRIDELEERMNSRFEDLEARLTQRIELSEERLGQQVERVRTQLLQWLMGGLGAVVAILTLVSYLLG